MYLYLRKVIYPQARDNYRVVLKGYIPEIEIGSIGIQHGIGGTEHWTWAIDNEITMRKAESRGRGKDRKDCMRQFRAAWDKFSADSARLSEFLQSKRKRL